VSIEQVKEEQGGYATIGKGSNLILVPGWGMSSAIWQPVLEKLSQHYCVYLVDLPGLANQQSLEDYSLENIAATLLEKLPKNAVWCGWSLGGLIASYISYAFPERVDKLIQVCASLKFVEEDSWLGVKGQVFEQFKQGVIKQPEKVLNRFISLQAMGSETVKDDIVTIKSLLKNSPQPNQSALISGLGLLKEVDLRSEFSELTLPCLTIFGENDTLVPVNNASEVAKLNCHAQQYIFNKSAHAPFISEPDLFVSTVVSFIEDQG